jgi:Putative restriction endonuclease
MQLLDTQTPLLNTQGVTLHITREQFDALCRDSLSKLQAKMLEYRDNGVRLGWLINPQQRQVEIYRIGRGMQRFWNLHLL